VARIKVLEGPLSAAQRLVEAAQEAGVEQLEAVLACTFTFDRSFFDRVLEALCAEAPNGVDCLRGKPIDVVCDARHYRGHSRGYNVTCWRGSNLFHPKLMMLCFKNQISWIEGSLNLTNAGYMLNQELATFHQSDRGRLPAGILTLVKQLARQQVAAASLIADSVTNKRTDCRDRSVSSLDGPLLEGLLGRVREAAEVVLIAPFFDQREEDSPTLEATALRRLADAYPEARFRIYLPRISREVPTLQGNRAVFSHAFGPRARKERVGFCGVWSDRHPLHAKLVALRHGRGGTYATMLVGSPNLTENALLREGLNGNVELARELQVPWRQVERLLRCLPSSFGAMDKWNFEPPRMTPMHGWHALESATYSPLTGELHLIWRKSPATETLLCYAGDELVVPAKGPVRDFAIRDEEFRLETLSRANPKCASWCPITITAGDLETLAELPDAEAPPSWWLTQLLAIPMSHRRKGGAAGGTGALGHDAPVTFEMAAHVRKLAAGMRHSVEMLRSTETTPTQRAGRLNLLEKIFAVHDPEVVEAVAEKSWRLWVRFEVAEAVALAARGAGPGRGTLRRMALALRKQLSDGPSPPDGAMGWRTLLGGSG
jgi:hypothetical protein